MVLQVAESEAALVKRLIDRKTEVLVKCSSLHLQKQASLVPIQAFC